MEWTGSPLTRPLHSGGHCDLTMDPDSGKLFTSCSEDAEIYTLTDLSSDEPQCHEPEANVTFIKFSNSRLFVGLDNFQVQIFTYPEMQKDGILTRFTAPPSCIDLSPDNSFAVVGAKDFAIKIVHVENQATKLLTGHTAPVLSVAYDPREDFIVSSSCDGSYRFWKIGDTSCVKTWEIITKSNDFDTSHTLACMAWQPSKALFIAVPNKNQVHFLKRGSFEFSFGFQCDQLSDEVSIINWKESGEYLAICDIKGGIFIAELAEKACTLVRMISPKNRLTSFLWLPNSLVFVVADSMGIVHQFKNVIKVKSSAPSQPAASGALDRTCKGADDILDEMIVSEAAEDNGDEEDDGSISLDKIKNTYTVHSDDEAPTGGTPQDGDDIVEPNLDLADILPPAPPPVQIVSYQHPFIPSSSPVGLSSRYMKWNLVGIVRRHSVPPPENEEDEDAAVHGDSIDVEFHDTSFYHPIHITDTHEFTMADLTEQALLLATPKSPFNSTSLLQCHTFSFWDHSKSWTLDMPGKHEKITCICLGEGWCAASTDHNLLRIFSISGLQLSVTMLSGCPVSLAGHGDALLYAFQPSQTVDNDRFYSAHVYRVRGYEVALHAHQQFPRLKVKDSVIWVGFTLEGCAVVAFASGSVYMMKSQQTSSDGVSSGHCWLPVFNFTHNLASEADRIWTVGVTGRHLRAIYCKAAKFPAMLPRPIVTTYILALPLCHGDSEQTTLEQQLHEHRLFGTITQTELKSTFLKLFALACRTDRDCRAMDIADIMPNEETVVLAIKYATKMRKLQLAQKLSAIAHNKENLENKNEDTMEEETQLFSQNDSNQESAEPINNPLLNRVANSSAADTTTSSRSTYSFLDTSSMKKNPFKSSFNSGSDEPKKGSAIFDDLSLMKPDKLKIGADKKSSKLKLSQKSKPDPKPVEKEPTKKLTPFQAYFEDNRSVLQDENPAASTEELLSIGIKRWKTLSPEDKAQYAGGARTGVPLVSVENSKRKAEDSIEEEAKKSKVEQAVGSKLDQFSFT